jgi:hypothetical protein
MHDSHVPSVWQSSLGLVLRDLFLKQSVTASWPRRGGGWWWGGSGQLVAAAAHPMSTTVTPVEANIHALETLHLPLPLMLHPPPPHTHTMIRCCVASFWTRWRRTQGPSCTCVDTVWVSSGFSVLCLWRQSLDRIMCIVIAASIARRITYKERCVCVAGGALAVVFMGALMHDASKRVSNRCPLAIGALQSGSVSPGRR